MPINAALAELKAMYRSDPGGTHKPVLGLSNVDIERWSVDLAVPRAALYDQLALCLAHGFHGNELSFSFCDHVVNDIHALIVTADDIHPDLFWSVYLAFDAGEYYHGNNRNEDPVMTYTRPLIAQIVGKHGDPRD